MSHLTNIVIAGATGNLGAVILPGLLESTNPKFHVTAISRPDSKSSLPPADNLTVARGNLDDGDFIKSTFKGQDILLIILGFTVPHGQTSELIKAAADAGIKYVIPTEFGSDTANEKLVNDVPLLTFKTTWRKEIEDLGVSKWFGFITNPWTDFGIAPGMGYGFGINLEEKKATMYTGEGLSKFYTTTLPQVGRAVVALLKLPKDKLASHANKLVYIKSFFISQQELLEAVQSVVGSDGWQIEEKNLQEFLRQGRQMIKEGNMLGNVALIYGNTMNKGYGDVYLGELANSSLGLPEENLQEVVKEVVKKSKK